MGQNNHITDNQNILNIEITKSERKKIEAAQKSFNSIPGNCGDEYRKAPYLPASGDLSHHYTKIPKVFDSSLVSKNRKHISSKTKWESMASYSRAV